MTAEERVSYLEGCVENLGKIISEQNQRMEKMAWAVGTALGALAGVETLVNTARELFGLKDDKLTAREVLLNMIGDVSGAKSVKPGSNVLFWPLDAGDGEKDYGPVTVRVRRMEDDGKAWLEAPIYCMGKEKLTVAGWRAFSCTTDFSPFPSRGKWFLPLAERA